MQCISCHFNFTHERLNKYETSSGKREMIKSTEVIIEMERPKICCVDLVKANFESLQNQGYNLFAGSLLRSYN